MNGAVDFRFQPKWLFLQLVLHLLPVKLNIFVLDLLTEINYYS